MNDAADKLQQSSRPSTRARWAPEPHPLFRILRNDGFDYRCRFVPDGHFEVTIWHTADTLQSSTDLQ